MYRDVFSSSQKNIQIRETRELKIVDKKHNQETETGILRPEAVKKSVANDWARLMAVAEGAESSVVEGVENSVVGGTESSVVDFVAVILTGRASEDGASWDGDDEETTERDDDRVRIAYSAVHWAHLGGWRRWNRGN